MKYAFGLVAVLSAGLLIGCGSSGSPPTASAPTTTPTPTPTPAASSSTTSAAAPMPGAPTPMPGTPSSSTTAAAQPMPNGSMPTPGATSSSTTAAAQPMPNGAMPTPGGSSSTTAAAQPMPNGAMPLPGGTSSSTTAAAPMPTPGTTPMPVPGSSSTTGAATPMPTPMPNSSSSTTSAANGMPPIPGSPSIGVPGRPLTVEEAALDAFRRGHDHEAMLLVYAAALIGEGAEERLPDELKYVSYLRKPVLGIRWGIGIEYDAPSHFRGNPSPVGYVATPAPGSSSSSPSPSPGTSGQPKRPRVFGQGRMQQQNGSTPSQPSNPGQQPAIVVPSHPADRLTWFTGDIGERIVDLIATRMNDGKYGDVLQKAQAVAAPPPNPNSSPLPNMSSPTPSPSPGSGVPEKPFEPGQVVPGVTLLGEGSEKELLAKAEKEQVDFLVLFEVQAKPAGAKVANTTRFRVVSLDKAKLPAAVKSEDPKATAIYTSKPLNAQRIMAARDDGKDDPLDAEMNALAAALDEQIVFGPLPTKLNEETAFKRATFLADQETSNPLPNLVEIRCYHLKGLLTDPQAAQLAAKILGPDKAKKLITGKDENERKQALAKYFPKPR